MTSFEERLAKAKAAKEASREYRDVPVILDAGLGQLVDELRDELMVAQQEEAGDERLAQTFERSDALQAKLDAALEEAADQLVTLRFKELDSMAWADLKSRAPVRLGVDIDEQFGFNVDLVAVLASPICGFRVEDGTEHELTEEQWRDVFATISGYETTLVGDAIFDLNVATPARRLAAAKKAFATRQG
ncbi:hypothetical protein [Agromyces aureus]|uniref:Uncharacterized protein n=1 Tax=Agromyces aureus TaxID=453304 RepID=A0A191WEY4_9MICO|nr:hypothetical protein [Agromyces aureus]ANJ26821.1 hypothetical protein ATC03_08915 [Agromyces aureus]